MMKRVIPLGLIVPGILLSFGAFSHLVMWLAVSPAFSDEALQQILEVYP
jgi:hypothetical protein